MDISISRDGVRMLLRFSGDRAELSAITAACREAQIARTGANSTTSLTVSVNRIGDDPEVPLSDPYAAPNRWR